LPQLAEAEYTDTALGKVLERQRARKSGEISEILCEVRSQLKGHLSLW
jgi:hypothetical protein